MFILLKSEVTFKFIKIYSIKQKNKKVINVTFNKLHEQEKIT